MRHAGRHARKLRQKEVSGLPKVVLQSGETQEQLLRRFRKEVVKSRVLTDARRKRWFIPNSELRRIKEKKAARRNRRTQND